MQDIYLINTQTLNPKSLIIMQDLYTINRMTPDRLGPKYPCRPGALGELPRNAGVLETEALKPSAPFSLGSGFQV